MTLRRYLLVPIAFVAMLPALASGQTVRGHVVDSVTAEPLMGALVSLLDNAGAVVARGRATESGEFLLDSPAGGQFRIRVEHAGYRVSTFPPFELDGSSVPSYMLLVAGMGGRTTADFETVTAVACRTANTGAPIVAGWIRNARTGDIDPEAMVAMTWSTVPNVLSEHVSLSDFSGVAVADTNGYYAICGAPRDTKIALHAMSSVGLSNFFTLTFVNEGVMEDGELNPTTSRFWRHDMVILDEQLRNTQLSGIVTDGSTGRALTGADVEILGTPFQTTTDGLGSFTFQGLPSGPARLRVRRVGAELLHRNIVLPANDTLVIPAGALALGRAPNELEPITVETTAAMHPLAEFYTRRDVGNGAFVTREEFEKRGNPQQATDAIGKMQGVRLEPSGQFDNPWIVSMTRGGPRSFGFGAAGVDVSSGAGCPPLYFVDRQFVGNAAEMNVDAIVPLVDVEAVEAHASVASMPVEFNRRGSSCGVIIFWTRRAQMRAVAVPQEEGGSGSTKWHLLAGVAIVVSIFVLVGKAIHF